MITRLRTSAGDGSLRDRASAVLVPAISRVDVLGHGAERTGFLGSDHSPLLAEIEVAKLAASDLATERKSGTDQQSVHSAASLPAAASAAASSSQGDSQPSVATSAPPGLAASP
eukprot:CAMPEP_0181187830 /NCGR_PEP_ID=MMETSP1096-20121128/10785_1 /TAXON_ID=156174 ORGANISM="Chrysochromulina ericina, Strain CCMP281" /NCGR_SAMPLE_ID=MMETSP1096 /ASSEMBLY_ACC=CAM_ASM_000453 /LENGTH=113 /DNA_ID=CAMNT_0023276837 /DNA_START=147 /DNA_END=486 /DNA_ORIENTATION=+